MISLKAIKMNNKPLRILHLIDHLPDYHENWGGAEKSAFRRIKVLSSSKEIETIVAGTKPKKTVSEKFSFYRIITLEDFFPKGLRLYITGFKNQIFPFDLISFFSSLFLILKIKPSVVHLHKANQISFSPITVCRLLRIPVVLSISDYWYLCPSADLLDEGNICRKFQGPWCSNCSATRKFGFVRKFAYLYRKQVMDYFLSEVSAFRVSSQSSKDLLEKYGIKRNKLVIVRQVFNKETLKIRGKIKRNTIYLNAWMSPHKGVHIAVAAMAEVVKKISNARLIIETKIFDKKYEEEIMKMISDFKLEKSVEINQKSDQKTYLRRINEAAVIIVPEQWENMGPTTLGDAMALGKPIVASKIGGIPEFIRDRTNGLLVRPTSPSEFASKITKLLKNYSLAEKYGSHAKKDMMCLGSEKECLINLLRLYNRAIGENEY
jgi:glycosyltransferase involved in cell wall biosynthesis